MLRESTGVRVPSRLARGGVVLLAAMGLLVSACGSGDEQSSPGAPVDTETTAPVAGAQENAVGSGAMCYVWPNGTTDPQPCTVGLKGPGGGRVFYDAGSEQPWGRFLEVAPQTWGETQYDCSALGIGSFLTSGCGRDKSLGVPDVSSDIASNEASGWLPCSRYSNQPVLLPGEAGSTSVGIGAGRRNTEVLLQAADCYDGTTNALERVTNYRIRSGRSDWYLPSAEELIALCKYDGRNAIGGFGNWEYMSSTTGPKSALTTFYTVSFAVDPASCSRGDALALSAKYSDYYENHSVRPIRAFS